MRRHQPLTNHGAPCPLAFEADLTTPRTFAALKHLHLDHEQDVTITCDMWVSAIAALPHGPGRWDDGVDGGLLCHLLFGVRDDPVHDAAMLRFRCRAAPCHTGMPHYHGVRDVAAREIDGLETVSPWVLKGGADFDLDVCVCVCVCVFIQLY